MKECISEEMILNSYPPTKEQFINLFRDTENLYALTEYHGRCPTCFWNMKGDLCGSCENYYSECDCTPLTPSEIIEGWQ